MEFKPLDPKNETHVKAAEAAEKVWYHAMNHPEMIEQYYCEMPQGLAEVMQIQAAFHRLQGLTERWLVAASPLEQVAPPKLPETDHS